MKPEDFLQIAYRADDSLVVMATSKVFGKTSYKYIMGYKGLAFYTKSPSQLSFGSGAEVVHAKTIWIPG